MKGATRAGMRALYLPFCCCGLGNVEKLAACASTGSSDTFGTVEVLSVIASTGSRAEVLAVVASTGFRAGSSALSPTLKS